MSSTVVLWCCFIAIIISIVCNFVWGVNMGLMAMSFAFVIGCLLNGNKVSEVFGYWPDSLIFFVLASALFYGFATENGTVVLFGKKLMYLFRKHLMLIPWAFFIVAAIMSFLGAGLATMVLLSPVAFAVGAQLGMGPVLMSCAVNFGYVTGTYNPWTGNGVQMVGLMKDNGVEVVEALRTGVALYGSIIVRNILLMAVSYIIYAILLRDKKAVPSVKAVGDVLEKPEPFNTTQKKTLGLIVGSFILILVPSVYNTMFEVTNPVLKNIVAFCQPQSLMVICALIASLMKLADTKNVLKRLPMNTILLIAGVGFLMKIASSVGLDEMVVALFESGSYSPIVVVTLITALCGFLSLFSSTFSVVLPMMYPLVPALSAATGVVPATLYIAIIAGASSTTLCPFSTAGAQQIALAPQELQEKMVPGLLIFAIGSYLFSVLLASLGFYSMFNFIL